MGYFEKTEDLLWAEQCQPATTAQMNEIKSQFHPSNTANVNIVPYEIYDEDGTEIVVGEVRKTIDGVKKRKPVHEKTVNIYSSITSGMILNTISSLEDVKLVQGVFRASNGIERNIGYNDGSQYMHVYRESNDIKTVFTGVFASSQPITKISITIQYTKTTDEWTPV